MSKISQPITLTPDQRRIEIAALLARGVLRALRARRNIDVSPTSENGTPSQISLEVLGKTRLSVSTGSGG